MKKVLLIALAVAGVAFTSCTKNVDPVDGGQKVAIGLGADIMTTGAANGAATKADNDKFPANLTPAFAVTAYKGAVPTTFASAYFSNANVNSNASAVLAFAATEYYPNDDASLYFYAFAPAGAQVLYTEGTTTVAPKATYTITGKEDLLWAKEVNAGHNKTNAATPVKFTFQHMLKQVSFTVKGTDAFALLGKKLQSLKITNANNKATLDIITGALAFEAVAPGTLTAHTGSMIDITDTASAKFGTVMFEAGNTFNIEVGVTNTAENFRAVVDLSTLTGQGGAGYSYTVNLKLDVSGNKIIVDADITPWLDGGEIEVPVN